MANVRSNSTTSAGRKRSASRALRKLQQCQQSAEDAGLRYTSDEEPGYRRVRRRGKFAYLDPQGRVLKDEEALQRIRKLGIPPAWENVWICAQPNGHLQATGLDARGRKQYRYHAAWRERRDSAKYERVMEFGRRLPRLREAVQLDLQSPGLTRRKVLATVVRLLETTLIRVGNQEYARTNKSFGLTTMQDRHVIIKGCNIRFQFRGKSGITHDVDLENCELAEIVKNCRDVPGQVLFQYLDENGNRRTITSTDVNAYLKEISGRDFTAKDFRTWAGTMLAAQALRQIEMATTQRQAKTNIRQAIESVAMKLGNTPTICRKCYVHPAVLDAYVDGSLARSLTRRVRAELHNENQLTADEKYVMRLLKNRLDDMMDHQSADGLLKRLSRSVSQKGEKK